MAFYLSDEECETIMAMHRLKQTLAAIQGATGRDPKTIRKVITAQETGHAPTRRARESKLDPYVTASCKISNNDSPLAIWANGLSLYSLQKDGMNPLEHS